MQGDDHGHRAFGGAIARAGALVLSASVATLLILNSGPGCDAPKTEASKPAPTQEAAPAPTQEAAPPVTPAAAAAPAPVATPPVPADSKAEPVPADGKSDPGTDGLLRPNAANEAGNAFPRYLPASKAGVFIEPNIPIESPAREPAVQENAPPQQAPPQEQGGR